MQSTGQPKTFGIALTLIICGTCLVLMPQIHESVVSANTLFALGIARDSTSETASLIERASESRHPWMAILSVTVGVFVIGLGALLGGLPTLHRLRA